MLSNDKKSAPIVTKRLIFHFLWIVIVWRLILAFSVQQLGGFTVSAWLNSLTWIGSVIIGLGTFFSWWRYRKKHGEYPFGN